MAEKNVATFFPLFRTPQDADVCCCFERTTEENNERMPQCGKT